MTGFKPQTSGIGSDRSATTTTAWVNFLNQISCNNDLVRIGGSWYSRLVSCDDKDVYAKKPVM